MAEPPPDVVDELYGAPLDEFVPLRDERAKELRAGGRREEADAVKRLRKPSVPAWAVNQLRRRDRDGIEGLMAVGAALRQAKAGAAIRNAAHEEREAVSDLVQEAAQALRDAGREPSAAMLDEIRQTLHAASADAEARELVAAGRVVQPLRAIGLGGGMVAPPAPDEQDERDDRAERERAKRRLAKARDAVRAAKAEVRDRERDLRSAERAAEQARAAYEAARRRLEERESGLSSIRD